MENTGKMNKAIIHQKRQTENQSLNDRTLAKLKDTQKTKDKASHLHSFFSN